MRTIYLMIFFIFFTIPLYTQNNSNLIKIKPFNKTLLSQTNPNTKHDLLTGYFPERPQYHSGFTQITVINPSKPPLSKKRIVIELFGGTLVGLTTAVILFPRKKEKGDLGERLFKPILQGVFAGAATITTTSGFVYFVGSMDNQNGSFKKTILGSLIGAVITYNMGKAVTKDKYSQMAYMFSGIPIGATISFNLTREYRY
ncbi:MAG: hypothetical protein KAR38_05155 [Calditrichia bacterium]|nr:hypothetical protein [Calditrichia bacterium]